VVLGTLIAESFRGEDIEELAQFYNKIALLTCAKELGLDRREIIEVVKIVSGTTNLGERSYSISIN